MSISRAPSSASADRMDANSAPIRSARATASDCQIARSVITQEYRQSNTCHHTNRYHQSRPVTAPEHLRERRQTRFGAWGIGAGDHNENATTTSADFTRHGEA